MREWSGFFSRFSTQEPVSVRNFTKIVNVKVLSKFYSELPSNIGTQKYYSFTWSVMGRSTNLVDFSEISYTHRFLGAKSQQSSLNSRKIRHWVTVLKYVEVLLKYLLQYSVGQILRHNMLFLGENYAKCIVEQTILHKVY